MIPWTWKHLTNRKVQGKKVFCHVMVKNYLCNVSWRFLIKIETTWSREIKEQTLQLTLLYDGRTVRSSHRRFCTRKLFLQTLQYPQEKAVLESIFKKLQTFRPAILLKRDPNTGVFLLLLILKNICKRLLFNFFNGLLLHGPKGLIWVGRGGWVILPSPHPLLVFP